MKQQLLIFCLICCAVSAYSQEQFTQTIRGKVIDQESQMPLIGANVLLLESDPVIGVNTDVNGTFKLVYLPF